MTTQAALIVIDVQQGFEDSEFWGQRDNPAAEANIVNLMDAWDAVGAPLVIVQHASLRPSPLLAGTAGYELKPVVAGRRHDLLVTKHVNSAFYGDVDLHAWLTEQGISEIILCGIQTNMCVETTARMGGNLGYSVTVALDACHTFDAVGPFGAMTATELSRATATSLSAGRFAAIESSETVIARTEAARLRRSAR